MDDPNRVPDHLYVPGPKSPKTSHGFTRRQLAMGMCPENQLTTHQLACMQVEMQSQLIQKLHGGHARTFWDAPSKAKFLIEVLQEREPEYNSEDDTGRPIWNKHKCPKYKEEYAKMEKNALEQRDRIENEDKERVKDIKKFYEIPISDLPWVPNKKEQYRLDDIALGLKNSYENMQENKRLKFQLPRATDYISNHDSTNFFCSAQTNISMINYIYSKEKRIEFAIIGLRERRRYNQAKRLGFHIPFTYKKIWKIFNCDFYASNFILKYPHVITDDPDYEDDEEVKKKDPKEITKYIMKGTQRYRDHLEMKGIQSRMIEARMKVGDYPMDEPMVHIVYQAQDEFLHRHGTEKGFTEAKRLGLYKRNPLLDNLPYFDAGYHLQLMLVIERWLTKYPNIFVHFKYLIDFVLAKMGNDFTFMPLYPHVVLGMFKHREHDVPKCLRSPDWNEQVISARKRYAQENDPDRQVNPGLPKWTIKNICPWEKNELVLSQMIYQKLGIDPFRDVMNHDPKVIEDQASKMDSTELIKEFYEEEKKQLPEFTATIFKELERRESIGLHLKIQTTIGHKEHPLATNDFPGREELWAFVERAKVLDIRRSYYEDRGKTHPDSSQWIRKPIEIEYLRNKAEREHRLEYFPQTLIEDEKRISIMSLNQQQEELSRRLSSNSKSEQKLSSEQFAQSDHSYRVSSIEEDGSNNQYVTAQKSSIRYISSKKPSGSSSKNSSEKAQLEEQKFLSEFGEDPDQAEIQKLTNSEEKKRAQIMEDALDQSSEMNSEKSEKNRMFKFKRVLQKKDNLDKDEYDRKKKKRPKLYRQIVAILKENCDKDGKKYVEDLPSSKYQRKLTRRELNPKEKWDQLGSSAEDSDNSLLHTTYNDNFLGAKQKQLLQKDEPQKKLKKERGANEIVDIDGTRQKWGTFKKIFEEDTKLRKIKGEQIEEVKFLLNKDDPKKEKILTWNTHYGFVSENSDDENTNFLRVQRKLMKERQEQHSEPFLRERKIKTFETLMLLLGGKQIFEQYLGKSIEISDISSVLDWQDPLKLPFFQFGNFFMAESQEVFDLFYNAERNMQERLAGEEIASKSIFVNEFVQLYLVFMQVLKDNQEQWARKLLQILPKSFRAYQWDCNLYGFKEFKSLSEESGKKRSSLSILSNESLQIQRHEDQSVKSFADEAQLEDSLSKKKIRKSSYNDTLQDEPMFDHFSQDQSQVVGEDQDMAQEVVQFPNNQSPIQELSQRLSEELSIKQDLRLSAVKQSAPQTQQSQAQKKQDKVASFYVPPSNKPNYQELKNQLIGYQKASYESDARETALLISNYQLIDPVQIQNVLLPQLEEIVQNSDGRLERVFIWPNHRVEGNALVHPNERRYPKRLKEFSPKHEDTPIFFSGVEIGYFVSKIPSLKSQLWGGYGVPLSNKVFQEQTHPNLNASSNGQQHKKRKMDALNLGAGLSSYQKEEGMHKIEEALPFMRTVGQQNCTFDLLKIDETHANGTEYQIQLALPQGQLIQQRAPMIKRITIECQMPLTISALYLSTVEMTALGQNKTNARYIYTQALVNPGQIWTLTNKSDQTLYININLKKNEL